MAEGLARHIAPPGVSLESAGSSPTGVHHLAVRAMRELGIDISAQYSKSINTASLTRTGTVVTLCGEQVCPRLPDGVVRIHWPIDDPAAVAGSEEEQLSAFRRARDEIRHRIADHFAGVGQPTC